MHWGAPLVVDTSIFRCKCILKVWDKLFSEVCLIRNEIAASRQNSLLDLVLGHRLIRMK